MSSTSASTSIPQTAYPTTQLKLDCPARDNTSYNTTIADKLYVFDLFCHANVASGHDIRARNTSSLNDCIDSCFDVIQAGATCTGVVWNSLMDVRLGSNCFPKISMVNFTNTEPQDEKSAVAIKRRYNSIAVDPQSI